MPISDIIDAEESIITKLGTIGVPVYTDIIPDESSLPRTGRAGEIGKFIVVTFANPIVKFGEQTLCSPEHDGLICFVQIKACSGSPETRKELSKEVLKMVGFKPTYSGSMELRSGRSYSEASSAVKPSLYVRAFNFEYLGNVRGTTNG